MFVGGEIPSRTLRRSIYKPKQGIVLRPGSPENRPGPSPVQKNQPPKEDTAGSTAGRVPVIPAPGREHSDLQGHKGLAVLVPGFELPSPGAGHQQDPYTPALPVPLPALSPHLSAPSPSPYREAVGLGSGHFLMPIPALLPTNCVTLGRSFHLPRLFLNTHKVLFRCL